MAKNPSPATLEKFIAELYARGSTYGDDGTEFKILPMSLPPERGAFLSEICRAQRPGSTIEIGMAYGLSTLLIVQTLLENGVAACAHTVMDPFQSSTFHDAGRRAIREAGVEAMVDFHPDYSEYLLPRLLQEGRRFDFAFIDGNHRFDHVFVDLFYINRLLRPSGVLVLDDCFSDSVHFACRFLQANYGYSAFAQYPANGTPLDDEISPPGWRPMMRAMRKPIEEAPSGKFHFAPFFPLARSDGSSRVRATDDVPPDLPPSTDPSPAAAANLLRHRALAALERGERGAARAGFVGALRLEPLHFKTYLRLARTFFPASVTRMLSSPARRRAASRRK
jgi:predicted O-methyltransferase YrrM